MAKVRIYQLAKKLGINNTELVQSLSELGISVKSHMSTIDAETANIVREMFSDSTENEDEIEEEKTPGITVKEPVTIQSIADALGQKGSVLMKKLIENGLMLTINQTLSPELIKKIEEVLDIHIEYQGKQKQGDGDEGGGKRKSTKRGKLVPRPPVVTIMGHVDHGKTLLLDTIRKTNVVDTEAGGITQHIGAYQVNVDGKPITFLDTPGHEAFTSMRARGAQVTDIAILVVAADDGVMPQTIEAINHARSAGIPIVVALNKIDKANANPDRVKQQLAEQDLIPEEWGGSTIVVELSALQKLNIDELLEMILLVAEMEDLKAVENSPAQGVVIEAQLDRGRGPVATVLIQEGTLQVGDPIILGDAHGRVRAMFNDRGERMDGATPSTPVEVLGISTVPAAGDRVQVTKNEKTARSISLERQEEKKSKERVSTRPANLEEFFKMAQEGEAQELKLIIKGDVDGSVEALKESLARIKSPEVKLDIIHSGVGAITEGDVILATASKAIIIGFNVRPDNRANKVAEREKVDIRTYRVIYQVIEDIKKALEGMLKPDIKEKVLGRAEVRETFRVPKVGTVAGLYVLQGKITRNSKIRVIRDGVVLYEGTIASLKRFKDDVREVEENYECGLGLENFQDVRVGDILEAFVMEEVKRSLD